MSEANRQSAHDALEASRRSLARGQLESALRLCKKSINLCPDSQAARDFLKELEALAREGTVPPRDATPQPQASTSTARPPQPARQDSNASGNERPFTPKQVAMIKRVRACKKDAYYEILEVEKTCDDMTVKKAFRKMCLVLHPDKCGAPGTDEAFKIVAKAAEVLGDPQKRSHYDRYGTDPDDRRAQAAASGFGGAGFPGAGMRRGPATFGDEINPEDLFNMFFGGGFGPGVRMQSFGGPAFAFGGMPRRPHNQAQGQGQSAPVWLQLLPLLFLCGLSLLSYLPSLWTTPPPPMPGFRFTPSAVFQLSQETHQHHVEYFVDPAAFSKSHVFNAVLRTNPSLVQGGVQPVEALAARSLASVSAIPTELRQFEKQVEATWVDHTSERCRQENADKQRRIERASGFLGIGRDINELKRVAAMPMPGCQELKRLGYRLA